VAPSAMSSFRTLRIAPGDSLWKIAKQNLGRGSLWPELAAANPSLGNPLRLRAGSELSLPAAPVVVVASPATRTEPRAAGIIRVHRGDTLWSLAKANLGRASKWPCLASANPSVSNPGRIFAAQELIIPAACPPSVLSSASPPRP
jgi:nucleoid-associated protein YgaU